jgi:hypothetical protein
VDVINNTHREHPDTKEIVIQITKKLIQNDEDRIKLEDFVSQESEKVIRKIDAQKIRLNSKVSAEEFRNIILFFESAVERLAAIAIIMGRWGNRKNDHLTTDAICYLCKSAEIRRGSAITLNYIDYYPAVLVFTCYALGLIKSRRWSALHSLFITKIGGIYHDQSTRAVDILFPAPGGWESSNPSLWKILEELKRKKTPLSEHLLNLTCGWSNKLLGIVDEFEKLFEIFELLGALVYFEKYEKEVMNRNCGKENPNGFLFMPVGRVGWDERRAEEILSEIQTTNLQMEILEANFAQRDEEILKLFIINFRRIAARMMFM